MQSIQGKVSKIRVLKLAKSPLVRFSVDDTSCLIALHSLQFLYEVQDDMEIVVAGVYNDRKQFIVRKFCVLKKEFA